MMTGSPRRTHRFCFRAQGCDVCMACHGSNCVGNIRQIQPIELSVLAPNRVAMTPNGWIIAFNTRLRTVQLSGNVACSRPQQQIYPSETLQNNIRIPHYATLHPIQLQGIQSPAQTYHQTVAQACPCNATQRKTLYETQRTNLCGGHHVWLL